MKVGGFEVGAFVVDESFVVDGGLVVDGITGAGVFVVDGARGFLVDGARGFVVEGVVAEGFVVEGFVVLGVVVLGFVVEGVVVEGFVVLGAGMVFQMDFELDGVDSGVQEVLFPPLTGGPNGPHLNGDLEDDKTGATATAGAGAVAAAGVAGCVAVVRAATTGSCVALLGRSEASVANAVDIVLLLR